MEISRRTWAAAVKLAAVLSIAAAVVAVLASQLGNIPNVLIVLPVVVVAFTASWVQTERIRKQALTEVVFVPLDSVPGSNAS